MKILITAILLFFSLAATRPAESHLRELHRLPLLPCRPGARPLTRYLAAMLHLTPKQASAVQQALRNYPARPLAPEDLTMSLGSVLTLEAQERLQALQANATTYQALYYLAARH